MELLPENCLKCSMMKTSTLGYRTDSLNKNCSWHWVKRKLLSVSWQVLFLLHYVFFFFVFVLLFFSGEERGSLQTVRTARDHIGNQKSNLEGQDNIIIFCKNYLASNPTSAPAHQLVSKTIITYTVHAILSLVQNQFVSILYSLPYIKILQNKGHKPKFNQEWKLSATCYIIRNNWIRLSMIWRSMHNSHLN